MCGQNIAVVDGSIYDVILTVDVRTWRRAFGNTYAPYLKLLSMSCTCSAGSLYMC